MQSNGYWMWRLRISLFVYLTRFFKLLLAVVCSWRQLSYFLSDLAHSYPTSYQDITLKFGIYTLAGIQLKFKSLNSSLRFKPINQSIKIVKLNY